MFLKGTRLHYACEKARITKTLDNATRHEATTEREIYRRRRFTSRIHATTSRRSHEEGTLPRTKEREKRKQEAESKRENRWIRTYSLRG